MLGDADKHAARVRQRLRTSKPLCWLGDALRFDDRYDDAAAVYRTAVLVHPEEPEALVGLATVLYAQGDYEAAVPVFQKCLELSPDDSHLSYDLADALEMTDRLDEAIAVYERLVEIDPTEVNAHYLLGNIHERHGRYDQAAVHYRAAVDNCSPYSWPGRLSASEILAETCRCEVRATDQAVFYYSLGNVLSAAGEREEALRSYTQAVERCPDEPLLQTTLEKERQK